MFLAEENTKC